VSPLLKEILSYGTIRRFSVDKKPVFWKPWNDKKIFFIKDLLTYSGDFLSFNQFKEKYNIDYLSNPKYS